MDQNSPRECFISLEEFFVTEGSPRLADSSRIVSRSHSRWLATAVSLVLLFSHASCHNIMVTKYKLLLLLQDSHQSQPCLRELDLARKMVIVIGVIVPFILYQGQIETLLYKTIYEPFKKVVTSAPDSLLRCYHGML